MQSTSTAEPTDRTPTPDGVDPVFLERYSPSSFSEEPVSEAELEAVFEAARWAPSSYNEQPWRFVYATEPEDRDRFLSAILEGNRTWAKHAPVLMFVLTKQRFAMNGKTNPHAWFDAGSAWMSLTLQATTLGLATHAMAGIHPETTREVLNVPEGFDVVCALALGHPSGEDDTGEERADRLPRTEIAHEGGFGGHPR